MKTTALSTPLRFVIVRTLPSPNAAASAIRTFYDAFASKLRHFQLFHNNEEQAYRLMSRGINFSSGLYAVTGDDVLGVAALDYGGRNPRLPTHFLKLTYSTYTQEFGWFGGAWRWAASTVLDAFSSKAGPDDLRIAGLAVSPRARGKGVGTALLNTIAHRARRLGYCALTLEVVDTNEGARRLYERMGFTITHTDHVGVVTAAAGFTRIHHMRLPL